MIKGKPVTVERIPSGEYHVHWWTNGSSGLEDIGFTGEAAQVIIMLSRILLEDEATEILNRKRKESNAIGAALIADMKTDPKKFVR